ncbi:hypothetical protein C8R44DRAFT_744881 [Mycena epipterygia]|nr:hypothetical protein C8R44DRAFT_744881 [Mycena epipterygia]
MHQRSREYLERYPWELFFSGVHSLLGGTEWSREESGLCEKMARSTVTPPTYISGQNIAKNNGFEHVRTGPVRFRFGSVQQNNECLQDFNSALGIIESITRQLGILCVRKLALLLATDDPLDERQQTIGSGLRAAAAAALAPSEKAARMRARFAKQGNCIVGWSSNDGLMVYCYNRVDAVGVPVDYDGNRAV